MDQLNFSYPVKQHDSAKPWKKQKRFKALWSFFKLYFLKKIKRYSVTSKRIEKV